MSVEKLERVLWRVRKTHPNSKIISNNNLRRAIMYECGTDPVTYRNNRRALVVLGWIKKYNTGSIELTDKDLE